MVRNFKINYKKLFDVESEPQAVNAYDGVYLLARAMRRVGFGPDAVARDLTTKVKNWQGASGKITLNSDCEMTRRGVVLKVIKNGKLELLR